MAWIDPYPADAGVTLEAFATEGGQTYLLLDTAFDPEHCAWLGQRWSMLGFASIYDIRYVGKDLEAIAPRVMRMPTEQEARSTFFGQVLHYAQGLPMFSLLRTQVSLDHLVSHLQCQMEAVDAAGHAYLLRLADTRSLALLRTILTPAQRARWMQSIHAWGWFERDGRWFVDTLPKPDETLEAAARALPDVFQLDATQVQAVQHAATADTVLNYLQSSQRSMTLHGTPSALHTVITASLDQPGSAGLAESTRRALAALFEHRLISMEQAG